MAFGAGVSDLFNLDLADAPPFSTVKGPVMYTELIPDNAAQNLLINLEFEDQLKLRFYK